MILIDTSVLIDYLKGKPETVRDAILNKDFQELSKYSEMDAINMHAIMMTSTPPAYYFAPGTIDLIKKITKWRTEDGLDVFFTIDAGPNIHAICTSNDSKEVEKRINKLSYVDFIINNKPCTGTRIIKKELF